MKKSLKLLLVLGILSVILIPTQFGWAADKVRGVTDTEILIGQWGPQTGPAAHGEPWPAAQESSLILSTRKVASPVGKLNIS